MMLATREKATNVTDAAKDLDLARVLSDLNAEDSRELGSSAFVSYLMQSYAYTIEFAKNVIYALVELGRVELTSRYTLRVIA